MKQKVRNISSIFGHETLGSVMRSKIAVIGMLLGELRDRERGNKNQKIHNLCRQSLRDLEGMSALPEVEAIPVGLKLPARINEWRRKYHASGERMRKIILAQKRKENKSCPPFDKLRAGRADA